MGFWSDFLDAGKDVAEDAFDSVTDKLTSKEGLSALGKL